MCVHLFLAGPASQPAPSHTQNENIIYFVKHLIDGVVSTTTFVSLYVRPFALSFLPFIIIKLYYFELDLLTGREFYTLN